MSRDSLGFEFALVGFLMPMMKAMNNVLQGFSQEVLKNIVLCMIAGAFICLVFKRTEPRREPVNLAGINFPPWLPSAICCLVATMFLMWL